MLRRCRWQLRGVAERSGADHGPLVARTSVSEFLEVGFDGPSRAQEASRALWQAFDELLVEGKPATFND